MPVPAVVVALAAAAMLVACTAQDGSAAAGVARMVVLTLLLIAAVPAVAAVVVLVGKPLWLCCPVCMAVSMAGAAAAMCMLRCLAFPCLEIHCCCWQGHCCRRSCSIRCCLHSRSLFGCLAMRVGVAAIACKPVAGQHAISEGRLQQLAQQEHM